MTTRTAARAALAILPGLFIGVALAVTAAASPRSYHVKGLLEEGLPPWREGRALTTNEIRDGMMRHENRLLKRRGEAIAQHEAFTARSESREEAMLQVLDRPDVEDVTRRWQLGFPREHRPHHAALEGRVVSLRERFDLGNGLQARCPHDSELPLSETAGCRCSCVYRVKLKENLG